MKCEYHLSGERISLRRRAGFGEGGVSPVVGAIVVIGVFVAAFVMIYPAFAQGRAREEEAKQLEGAVGSFLRIQKGIEGIKEMESFSIGIDLKATDVLFTVPRKPRSAFENKFGTLEFCARNRFYPDRSLVFEGGAVIENQGGRIHMSSPPAMVSASDIVENDRIRWVRVEVHYLLIENFTFGIVAEGGRQLRVTCTRYENVVSPENDIPNREMVVIPPVGNLRENVRPGHEDAWRSYLRRVLNDLISKGYDAELTDGDLRLIIYGFHRGLKDIFYYEKVKRVVIEST